MTRHLTVLEVPCELLGIDMSNSAEHFTESVGRWEEAEAQLWSYSVSHSKLEIKLTSSQRSDDLFLVCELVDYVQSLACWSDAQIALESCAEEGTAPLRLLDVNSELVVLCHAITAEVRVWPYHDSENATCKPSLISAVVP